MTSHTCITCQVRFTNDDSSIAAELQKSHFQSDWHRYNLRRKIADLPPVSLDAFNEKLASQITSASLEKERSWHCDICSRKFSSEKSYENHTSSKKHKISEQKNNTNCLLQKNNEKILKQLAVSNKIEKLNIEVEEVEDEDWEGEPIPTNICLFCSLESSNISENIEHMTKFHGFFIPDLDYVIDLQGLVEYYGEKVGRYFMCLWCNEKGKMFNEVKSVQQHMKIKGHCKVFHEGDAVLEFADFYDYRQSYPDYNGLSDCEESDEKDALPDLNIDGEGFQLVLPSGCTVGHRSLALYYKQKLRPSRQLTFHNDSSSISRIIAQYKALGWTGTTGQVALRKAKDIAYVERVRSKHYLNVGVKANKLQRHFRDQNFGF